MRKYIVSLGVIFLLGFRASGQTLDSVDRVGVQSGDSTIGNTWSSHFQLTIINQVHLKFHAKYSGTNSLDTSEPSATSITTTLFLGRRLWKHAFFFFTPELSGGA